MPSKKRFVRAIAVACTAIAIAGCGDDGPAQPGGQQTPSCAPVVGKSVEITVAAGDWTTDVSIIVVPPFNDTTTTFSGTASIAGKAIQNVNPGDTLCIRVVFSDPLVVSETVPPYVAVGLGGGIGGGCQSGAAYHSVFDGGDWGVTSGNAGVRHSGSCPPSDGAIHGYWHNLSAGTTAEGDVLYCLRTKFTVPATFGSTPVASNQTLPVETVTWYTTLDGDRRSDPFPVQAK